MAWFGLYKSQDEKDADKAASDKVAQDAKNAVVLSNYRQTSRDQYNRQRQGEYSHYSPYMARVSARYGTSIPGMSNGPVTLADTGVGAAPGSNFTGWDDLTAKNLPGGAHSGTVVHHTGIGEYLDGTGNIPGTPYYTKQAEHGGGGFGSGTEYSGTRHFSGVTVDAVPGGGVTENVPAAPAMQFAPSQGGQAGPAPQPSFFPGRR